MDPAASFLTIYEISSSPFGDLLDLVMFCVAGLGAIALSRYLSRRNGRSYNSVFFMLWGTGVALISGFVVVHHGLLNHRAHSALVAGECLVKEGTVRVLRRQPREGHAPGDLIEVAGSQVELSYFDRTGPGYTTTLAYGGALQEGAVVRLWLWNGRILKIQKLADTTTPRLGTGANGRNDPAGVGPASGD